MFVFIVDIKTATIDWVVSFEISHKGIQYTLPMIRISTDLPLNIINHEVERRLLDETGNSEINSMTQCTQPSDASRWW